MLGHVGLAAGLFGTIRPSPCGAALFPERGGRYGSRTGRLHMVDMRQGYENHLPRRVITGRGASGRLAEICRQRGWNRAFVVSDRGVESAGLLAPVLALSLIHI